MASQVADDPRHEPAHLPGRQRPPLAVGLAVLPSVRSSAARAALDLTGSKRAQGDPPQCPAEAGPAFAVNGGLANHTKRINPANTQPIKVK